MTDTVKPSPQTKKEQKRAYERDINARIGRRIKAHRKRHKMTQRDIGDHAGVTPQQVQKWENGKNRISAARLRMLCEAFDITLDQFFFPRKN